MHFSAFRRACRDLTTPPAKGPGARWGGIAKDAYAPWFRLNRRSEASRLRWPASFAGCSGVASEARLPSGRTVSPESGCGKVTNRTSGPFPPSRHLQLTSYSAGTRPRRKRRPHKGSGPSADWHRCSTEETKKREFQRQAHASADHVLARTGVCWRPFDFV